MSSFGERCIILRYRLRSDHADKMGYKVCYIQGIDALSSPCLVHGEPQGGRLDLDIRYVGTNQGGCVSKELRMERSNDGKEGHRRRWTPL